MASPISGLTVANFRATPTRIGCAHGRNQRYQSVARRPSHFCPRVRDAVKPNSNFDKTLHVVMVSVKHSISCVDRAGPNQQAPSLWRPAAAHRCYSPEADLAGATWDGRFAPRAALGSKSRWSAKARSCHLARADNRSQIKGRPSKRGLCCSPNPQVVSR